MNKQDEQIIAEFKRRIPSDLAPLVKKVIVFGSRARGEAHEDSDLDVAVLVSKGMPQIQKQLFDIVYQVMWDCNFRPIISLKVFLEDQFQNLASRGFSFYKRVQNEGIAV